MNGKRIIVIAMVFAMLAQSIWAGGSKDRETTASVAAEYAVDRYHNIYNLPYDPDAKINASRPETKIGTLTVKVNATDGWLYVRDKNNRQLGSYSLKYQCWNSYSDVLNAVDLKLEQYYRSIDLSRTDLNRDKYGNFCGYTGATLPAEYTETTTPKTETGTNVSTGTGSSGTSGSTGNTGSSDNSECEDGSCEVPDAYYNDRGLPYDPRAVLDDSKNGKRIGNYIATFNKTSGWIYFRRADTGILAGTYNYPDQYWHIYYDELNTVQIDLAQFYKSIDLTKTVLDRDGKGNYCGYTGQANTPSNGTSGGNSNNDNNNNNSGNNSGGNNNGGNTQGGGTNQSGGTITVPTIFVEKDNLPKTTFTLLDGSTTDNIAHNRPKVIVFFQTICGNCMNTTRSVSAAYDKFAGVDVVEVEINQADRSKTLEFANKYDSSGKMKFSYNTGWNDNSLMWSYLRLVGDSNSVTLPVVVYIDANNKFQYLESGPGITADKMLSRISLLKSECDDGSCVVDETANNGTNQSGGAVQNQTYSDIQFVSKSHPSKTDYSAIDRYVKSLSIPVSMSYADAVKRITATCRNDKEKVRALFDFMSFNISYNTAKIQTGTITLPSGGLQAYYEKIAGETWKDRNGVCEGYGRLFVELCKAAGLDGEYISGNNKKFQHTYGKAYGNHGWNVVHVGDENILLDSCWGAGTVDGNEFTHRFADWWFDVDPYIMIFSHYPSDPKYQYLSPAVSKEKFDTLPRIDPTVTKAGLSGKEVYEFFLTHNKAWSWDEFGDFDDALDNGLVINKIPFTKSLTKNTEYVVNLSFPSSEGIYLLYENQFKKLTSGQDMKFTPKVNGQVKICRKTDLYYTMMLYTVEDFPRCEWEAAAKNVNKNLSVPSVVHGSSSSTDGSSTANLGPLTTAAGNTLCNLKNFDLTQLTLLDGTTLDNYSHGKPKVLIFFRTSCGNCQYTTRQIASNYSRFSGVDIIEVEIDGTEKSNVETYAQTIDTSGKIKFSWGTTGRTLVSKYLKALGIGGYTLPATVYIDSNNRFQYLDTGPKTANEILSRINEIETTVSGR